MLLSALPLGMVDTAYAAAALASGKCGDSATWTLDNTGTLTISGTGATYNYDMDDDGNSAAPWCTKARIQRVNKVVVNSGITELGYSMFSNCTQLTSVSLPSGLKRIGSCLFLGCTRLSAITIPSSVTTIESNAFTHCDSIAAITLPSGLRTMGDAVCSQMAKLTTATVSGGVTCLSNYAFNDCPSLKTITLPNTVRSIGICAFRYDTALKDVYFNGSVTQWTSIQIAGEGNSALYNADVHCTGLPAPTVAAVAAACVAAALPRSLALALDLLIGLVDLFHALLCQIGQRVVVIVVGMVFPRQITIGFFHFIVRGGAGNAQHLIGITHRWCPPFV